MKVDPLEQTAGNAKNPSAKERLGTRQTRRERAILALLQYSSMERVAQAAEVHPSTLFRWLKETEFQQQVRQARRQHYAHIMGLLPQASGNALQKLVGVLKKAD